MALVTAIVPARNEEATIAQAVESLAAQPEVSEIIVVNDQSTDRTGEILAGLARQFQQLKVVESGELPAAWTGKAHALWLGAQVARGEWLLFTDADVTHLPGSTAHALEDAGRSGAALASYSPEQETHMFWERALIPLVFARLARHFPFAAVCDPASPVAAANGQYLLIRCDAYHTLGGHSAVRNELIEDLELARKAKAAGFRLHFAPGKGITRTRMYRNFSGMWEGWTKNLYGLVGGRPGALLQELLVVLPWLPVALAALVLPVLGWLALILLVACHVAYAVQLRRIHVSISRIV
jgi:glycosyltransferase involved in cell wall biosynthesis